MTIEEAITVLNCVDAYGLANEAKKMAINALEKQKNQRWIPCSERLPEEEEYVLCQDVYGDIFSGFRSVMAGGWMDGEFTNIDVVAWMPLPEPYEEVK